MKRSLYCGCLRAEDGRDSDGCPMPAGIRGSGGVDAEPEADIERVGELFLCARAAQQGAPQVDGWLAPAGVGNGRVTFGYA